MLTDDEIVLALCCWLANRFPRFSVQPKPLPYDPAVLAVEVRWPKRGRVGYAHITRPECKPYVGKLCLVFYPGQSAHFLVLDPDCFEKLACYIEQHAIRLVACWGFCQIKLIPDLGNDEHYLEDLLFAEHEFPDGGAC
jgi:hypothetical protein